MLCLRWANSALRAIPSVVAGIRQPTAATPTRRALSTLSNLLVRPTLPSLAASPAARTSTLPGATPTSTSTGSSVQPFALQIRTGIRDTYNPSHVIRKRRHGFLSRLRTRTGRRTLKRRMKKGRTTLSH